jgi:hypothetical protein
MTAAFSKIFIQRDVLPLFDGPAIMIDVGDSKGITKNDDLMSEINQNHWAEKLFCAGIYHTNITVIYLVQNIFPKGKAVRTIILSTHYLILFDSRSDRLQIQTLGRQIFPGR